MISKEIKNNALFVFASLLTAVALYKFPFYGPGSTIAYMLLLVLPLFYFYRKVFELIKSAKGGLVMSLALSALASAFLIFKLRGVMSTIYLPVMFLSLAILMFSVTFYLISRINQTTFVDAKVDKINKKKAFFVYMLIIMLAWIPFFIVFFPGIMSIDSIDQWGQALGLFPLNNHHPVVHTMLIRFSTWISGDKSPWAYSLFQFLTMSASMSFVCVWLRLKGLKKYFVWVVLAFFALHPINPFYAITMWKDVLFSGAVMLFTVAIAEVVLSRGKSIAKPSYSWLLMLSGICVANLRNNGTLVALLAVILVFVFINANRRRMAIITVAILSSVVIKSLLLSSFNIPESSIRESLAIPIQQISRTVVVGGRISSSDAVLIQNVLPFDEIKSEYVENTVDPVKFSPKFNAQQLADNKLAYFGLWLRLLIDNPSTYVRAYLEETRGYWDPLDYNWGIFFGGIDNNDVGLNNLPQFAQQRDAMIQYTEKVHVLLPLRYLWSGAVYGYIMILMLAIMVFVRKRKNWLYLLAAAPFMLNWLTLMVATPTATNVRYIYCSFLVFPIIIFLSLNDRKATSSKK